MIDDKLESLISKLCNSVLRERLNFTEEADTRLEASRQAIRDYVELLIKNAKDHR
jgi:hypothetical protein